MEIILRHIALLGLSAAAVSALLGLLFVSAPRRRSLLALTAALGMLAIGLPIYSSLGNLGLPDPWPEPGDYDVLGWKMDESRRAIYAFVKRAEDRRPRLYRVEFDLDTAIDLQKARQHPEYLARIGMRVEPRPQAPPEVSFQFEKRVVIQSLAETAEREDEERQRQEALRSASAESGSGKKEEGEEK
jgi:hypothetical protein